MTLILLTKEDKLKRNSSDKGAKVTEVLSYFSRVFSFTGENDSNERMGDQAKEILEHYGEDLVVLSKHDAASLIQCIEKNKLTQKCELPYLQVKSQIQYYKEMK